MQLQPSGGGVGGWGGGMFSGFYLQRQDDKGNSGSLLQHTSAFMSSLVFLIGGRWVRTIGVVNI